MPVIRRTTLLLVLSNVFMAFAWCAHLRNMLRRVGSRPPANRIGTMRSRNAPAAH